MRAKKFKASEDLMLKRERFYTSRGATFIAGVDEAGCGPVAGPVVACAVILPRGYFNPRIFDSKLLTPQEREKLFFEIAEIAIDVGIGIATNEEIDRFNIRRATKIAMRRALYDLEIVPDVVLVDGNFFDSKISFWNGLVEIENIIKGDRNSISIASASILAKVLRDEIMLRYHEIYPQYNFASHKGYPTRSHIEALKKFGPTKIHRKTFSPIKEIFHRNEQ